MKMEAEVGVMLSQTKESQSHQKVKEARKGPPLEAFGEGMALLTPCSDFWPPDCERIDFYCLKPPSLG